MIIRKISSGFKHAYNFYLRYKGAHITRNFRCSPGLVEGMYQGLWAMGPALFGKGAQIVIGLNNDGSPGKLEIGDHFYMNKYTIIDCQFSIKIGNRVQIGPLCYITDFDHSVKVSEEPSVHRAEKTYGSVVIKDNAWIGAGCIILKGVTIGLNAVVGAGSVITKDVPDNTVFAGNPQRLIRTL